MSMSKEGKRKMDRILAIESDPKRANLLTALLRNHVNADLEIVDSVAGAITSFAENTPEVILAPTLLSPQDSEDLMTHVKRLEAPWVQILTLPALDMLKDRQDDPKTRPSFFRRRQVELGLQYDPAMVAIQIKDALERARTVRIEMEAAQANAAWLAGVRGETIEIATPMTLLTITQNIEAVRRPSACRAEGTR